MNIPVSIKTKDKEFEVEYLRLTFEASAKVGHYSHFYSAYLGKLNEIHSDLKINCNEEQEKMYFEMPFEIPYEEFFTSGYKEVCQSEMQNFADLLKPILRILTNKDKFIRIFDDYHKPDPIQIEVEIED